MKPGIKTTEFWVNLIAIIAGIVMSVLPETHVAVKIAGLVLAGIGSLGYTINRATVKKAEASANENGNAG